MNRVGIFLLACTLIYAFTGCGKKSISDSALATEIKAHLFSDPATKSGNITVSAKDGGVTLGGDVPTSDVELAAMKIANGTAGVKKVNDQMKVNAALAANAQAPEAPAAAPATSSQEATPAPAAPATPSEPAPAPAPAPPPQPATVVIPAGEHISVRTIQSIDSSRDTAGQVFRATLSSPLVIRRQVIVPSGAPVTLLLANAKQAGRFKGRSELEVRLTGLEYQGRRYHIDSSIYEQTGDGRGGQTARRTGIGAVAGAIIGGIAGGGKGAAIGAGAGAGAGAGVQLFTHGQKVRIPSETPLTFRLRAPLRIETGP